MKKLAWNSNKTYLDDSRILSGKNHPRYHKGKTQSNYLVDFRFKRKELINGINKCSCGKIAKILHHKDKNTFNNEYGNLLPLCSSCHTILHNKERGITIYKHNCEWCGKEFTILSNKGCKQKCCSLSCMASLNYSKGKTLSRNRAGVTYYEKNCKYCGKKIKTRRTNQLYCSHSCSSHCKKHGHSTHSLFQGYNF